MQVVAAWGADGLRIEARSIAIAEIGGSAPLTTTTSPTRSASPPEWTEVMTLLDGLAGVINVELSLDLTVPVIGRRRATHRFRIPIADGAVDYMGLEKDLSTLESALLDFAIRDGALVLEMGIPFLPTRGLGKPILQWDLAPADLDLARRDRIRLAVLPRFRTVGGESGSSRIIVRTRIPACRREPTRSSRRRARTGGRRVHIRITPLLIGPCEHALHCVVTATHAPPDQLFAIRLRRTRHGRSRAPTSAPRAKSVFRRRAGERRCERGPHEGERLFDGGRSLLDLDRRPAAEDELDAAERIGSAARTIDVVESNRPPLDECGGVPDVSREPLAYKGLEPTGQCKLRSDRNGRGRHVGATSPCLLSVGVFVANLIREPYPVRVASQPGPVANARSRARVAEVTR